MKKEYCIFKDGKLVFTISSLIGLSHYKNNPEYTIIENEKLDPSYSWTLEDGKIVRGQKWPVPEQLIN